MVSLQVSMRERMAVMKSGDSWQITDAILQLGLELSRDLEARCRW